MIVPSTETNLPIRAHFQVKNHLIVRIKLSPSEHFAIDIEGEGLDEEIAEWADLYTKRKEGGKLPLDFSFATPFMKKGLEAIASIKFGNVASYGEIAALAGCAKGARAIGNVCNKNPFPLVIPCHRVIQGNGSLGGFAYPLKIKEMLLDFES